MSAIRTVWPCDTLQKCPSVCGACTVFSGFSALFAFDLRVARGVRGYSWNESGKVVAAAWNGNEYNHV